MPFYDYACRCGEIFALSRPMDQRDIAAECPECQKPALRTVTAPHLSWLLPHVRDAHSRNEKSRHEPGLLDRHRCATACGCGVKKSSQVADKSLQVKVPKLGNFQRGRKTQRPWLLGH